MGNGDPKKSYAYAWGIVIALGLFRVWIGPSMAGIEGTERSLATMPSRLSHHPFQSMTQPLWLKAVVTALGLILIGLELWWFLRRKPQGLQKDKDLH